MTLTEINMEENNRIYTLFNVRHVKNLDELCNFVVSHNAMLMSDCIRFMRD